MRDIVTRRLTGAPQLFIKRDQDGNLLVIVAKTTDGVLVPGNKESTE